LHFDEPRKVLKLLEVKPPVFDEKFVLWRLPEALANPLLYLESFLAMKASSHLLFQKFIAIPGAVDLFMDRYIPLLGATSPIPLIEIILFMFIEKVGRLTNPVDVAAALWLGLTDVIRSPNLTTVSEGFRGAMIVFNLSRCLFPGEHHVEWLFELLEIASDRTELYSICVTFCAACDLPEFKPGRLCHEMIRHDSPDGSDIRLLSCVAMRTALRNPLFAIKYMFERGTSDSLLARTAAVSVVPLLQRHFEASLYVQDWVSRFARVAFEFVAVSQRRMKYRNRRMTVLFFFEAVVKFGFRPINHVIVKLWSTLIVGGLAPNWPIGDPLRVREVLRNPRRAREGIGGRIRPQTRNGERPPPREARREVRTQPSEARPAQAPRHRVAAPRYKPGKEDGKRDHRPALPVMETGRRAVVPQEMSRWVASLPIAALRHRDGRVARLMIQS
jgi:hypothetical protein